jgi:hypothetical protein
MLSLLLLLLLLLMLLLSHCGVQIDIQIAGAVESFQRDLSIKKLCTQ